MGTNVCVRVRLAAFGKCWLWQDFWLPYPSNGLAIMFGPANDRRVVMLSQLTWRLGNGDEENRYEANGGLISPGEIGNVDEGIVYLKANGWRDEAEERKPV